MWADPFDDEFFRRLFRRFREFDKEFEDMERRFRMDIREFEREPGLTGFRIEIRDTGQGRPEVKVTRLGEPRKRWIGRGSTVRPQAQAQAKRPKMPIKKMLQTNVCKVERPDEVVITMEAPGVEEDDVEVRGVGDTVEVIARKPTGEAYFCAVELPAGTRLEGRSVRLKGNMLVITIPRQGVSLTR